MMLVTVLDKTETYRDLINKLREEVDELDEAVTEYKAYGTPDKLSHMIEEGFDVQQIVVNFFDKVKNEEKVDLEAESQRHLVKMVKKPFNIKAVLRVKE